MKRIVFLLIAIALFTGIYVQESASAETVTVILSAMTQTYNGKPLKPTVTVKRSDGSVITPTPTITWTGAPKTAVGKYWVTAAVNTTSYTGSASGYFIISRPTGPVGGGTGGTTGDDNYWVFFEMPDPSILTFPASQTVKLESIRITATDPIHDPAKPAYEFFPCWDSQYSCTVWDGSLPSNTSYDILGLSSNGIFIWEPAQSGDKAFFNFSFEGENGIPVWDDIIVNTKFIVGDEPVELVRLWTFDRERYENTNHVERYYVEITPLPYSDPEPDDLTILSASYTKVCETRLLFGWWLYRYKLNVVNNGSTPLANVCGQVKSSSSSVKVIDPEVCFPEIPAGGSATSKGTFTFMAKNPDTSSLSWTYSSLRVETRPDSLVASSEAQPLSTYVVLSTSIPKSYYVLFHQWLPEGVFVDQAAPFGWTASDAQVWKVDQNVIAPMTNPSDIRAKAWLLNTLQEAEATVPIDTVP